MLKILLFLLYIIPILLVIFVERKSPTEVMLWVFVMICLPYVGTILYLIFGNTVSIKLTALIRNLRLKKRLPNLKRLTLDIDKTVLSETDGQVAHFNWIYNHGSLSCYETARFLTSGKEHYEQLFEDIRQAKRYIFMEFYTIHNDFVGEELVKALAEKAKQGVSVLVLCDFIANLSTPRKMFLPLIQAGGKVIRLKPYLTHYRSHRKIVTIDHQISYIGGMNIGKQYANLHQKKTPWRDTQIRMVGACTSILDEYFLTDWLLAVDRKDWDETVSQLEKISMMNYQPTNNLCQFILGGVNNDKQSVKMCYLSMIRSAKKRILIQSPYFIPDSSILDALKVASASGVKVALMIPGVKASFFLDPETNAHAGQLLAYGATVYKYRGYIHAKTMVIDDEICCIGSVNMDIRSLMVDDEICGVFYSNDLTMEYLEIFNHDVSNCDEYTLEDFNHRSCKERIAESVFMPFTPLM